MDAWGLKLESLNPKPSVVNHSNDGEYGQTDEDHHQPLNPPKPEAVNPELFEPLNPKILKPLNLNPFKPALKLNL